MAGKKRKRFISIISAAVIIAVCLFISLVPKLGLSDTLPTWNDIYTSAGIKDSNESRPLTVSYIDVGQGDSILIKTESNAVLIDAGNNGDGSKILSYMKSLGVSKLDYVVATHPHSDHIGGMDEVLSGIEVKNVMMTRLPSSLVPTTKSYKDLLNAVIASKAKVVTAEAGSKFSVGDMNFTVLAPIGDSDSLNNSSIVLKLNYGSTSFLFEGDAEQESEQKILKSGADVKADVLKVGHHGSRTATSDEYLKAVSPKYAVISCGKNNDYGHPHKETLEKRP